MPYIEVPIETEPVELAQEAFDYLEAQVPGWLPSPGNLEAWLIEALAQIAGELRTLAALVPDAIFVYFGESILGLPPYAATQATGSTTWTARDAAGYTVDVGTMVALTPPAATESYAFEVVVPFTIPAGETVAPAVAIRALEAGSAPSGLTGILAVIDPLDFIASVTLNAPTTGGADGEPTDAYLDRLSDLLTLLAPRPILPQDFALMIQREIPGIARATAIDLYNYATSTADVPRCVTVVPIDSDGEPVDPATKAAADALLQAQREANFLVFVGDPTYTSIAVNFTVVGYPTYDAVDVAARVTAQLETFLHPANWGLPPFGDPSTRSWINDTKVRYLEVAEQINRVDGVHYIASLQIAKEGQPMGTADVTLAGVAPLTRPGTITGTATIETS